MASVEYYSRREKSLSKRTISVGVSASADGVIGFATGIDAEVLREWFLLRCLDSERRGWSRSRYQHRRCVLYTVAPSFQRTKNYWCNEPAVCLLSFLFFSQWSLCARAVSVRHLDSVASRYVLGLFTLVYTPRRRKICRGTS